ncbi:MAG TPA: sugar nucleotide-binding protein, partial [Mobilitalea sp.]|nr:sugar nucleotide-binding protein [Mobilitalea sp.]
MKVLILGATGLVGKALMKELPYGYDVYGTYHSASNDSADNHMFQLSVQDTDRLVRLLEQINPDIVISCLRGEFNKQLELHRKLALVLSVKENSRLLFCSTANVFDALTDRPHYEADELRSDSDYGQYKIECEKQIKGILKDRAIILRLPMLWGKSSRRYNELIGQLTR